jgi:hypothetical protein
MLVAPDPPSHIGAQMFVVPFVLIQGSVRQSKVPDPEAPIMLCQFES